MSKVPKLWVGLTGRPKAVIGISLSAKCKHEFISVLSNTVSWIWHYLSTQRRCLFHFRNRLPAELADFSTFVICLTSWWGQLDLHSASRTAWHIQQLQWGRLRSKIKIIKFIQFDCSNLSFIEDITKKHLVSFFWTHCIFMLCSNLPL